MVIALSMTAGAQTQIKEHRRSITLDEAIVIALVIDVPLRLTRPL